MKQRLLAPNDPTPSPFKGVVSLTSPAGLPLLDTAVDDGDVLNDVQIHDSPSTPLFPNIASRSETNEVDFPSDPSSMNNPQDAVSDINALEHNDTINNGGTEFRVHEALIPSASPPPGLRTLPTVAGPSLASTPLATNVRSRKGKQNHNGSGGSPSRKHRRKRKHTTEMDNGAASPAGVKWQILCCRDQKIRRNIQSCMNTVARLLLWCTVIASVALVVWYSYELKNNGKDPHLIAWFSAGAFVLLGFPISLYGIVMHLANYNQPETQSYIVRILWMVPIYSIESWLCLRYKDYAIYIETLRDCYESYVLYSFLQFLIQVLGGEEALILMLKDKSPTRGSHMWGLQWCIKPWLMGQPVRKTYMANGETETDVDPLTTTTSPTAVEIATPALAATETLAFTTSTTNPNGRLRSNMPLATSTRNKPLKRVHWTSPFFVKCKFGVLQYVLLKFICSLAILILERYGLYKEGNFTYKGGYLYTCVLTNLSQCWALYCMIFFYYATKNELAPIRPVGKFLSVKALVFFTWWQSVGISILYQMDLIPHYQSGGFSASNKDEFGMDKSEPDFSVPMSAEEAMAFDQMGGSAFWTSSSSGSASAIIDYTPEDVAKGMQDYLICIEMFVAAIVHIFVFPHSEYTPEAVEARARALNQRPNKDWNKRLGRKWKDWDNKSAWSGTTTTSRDSEIELSTMKQKRRNNQSFMSNSNQIHRPRLDSLEEDDLMVHPMDGLGESDGEQKPLLTDGDLDYGADGSSSYSCDNDGDDSEEYTDGDEEKGTPIAGSPARPIRKKNFVSAFLDATIPQDLRDNTVGIIKGDYVVEKKTLLHHAATSDSYDLFSRFPRRKMKGNPSVFKNETASQKS
ncbi:organic solute transporter Ost alpha [Nitzschia inconspicua]|uniref:Organic solute transporter Ost alpha n=1 Tax=Nitzschia inconspicua TaxID=303405 RepID=A0A9K3L6J8_9STRA|nr:organic solute transporter Ost alpha [Nitzschia inconspicua]